MGATEDPAHGQQELEFYHGFYGGHCILPLLVFAAADDGPMELVAAVLRTGNSPAGRRSAAVLKRIVPPLKQAFPDAEILLRTDAGFALPEMYSFCEEAKIDYAISLPKNDRLGEASSSLMQEAQELRDMTRQKARLFDSFDYAAGTWPFERRVMVKAEAMTKGLNPRFVVTNLQGGPEEIHSFCCQRGDSENCIKEMKLDLFSGRTSCHRFTANAFRLLLHGLAFILMTLLRERLSGTELARCTMGTIRIKRLKMAAILEDTTRRTLVRLPRGHPHSWLLKHLCS